MNKKYSGFYTLGIMQCCAIMIKNGADCKMLMLVIIILITAAAIEATRSRKR